MSRLIPRAISAAKFIADRLFAAAVALLVTAACSLAVAAGLGEGDVSGAARSATLSLAPELVGVSSMNTGDRAQTD